MKKIYKIFLIISLLIAFSCELETDVFDSLTEDQFPENNMQLESISLAPYGKLTNLLDDWGWWLYMQEVSSDFLVFPQRGTDWEDGGKWRVLNRHTWTASTIGVKSMWYHVFQGVIKCNYAIDMNRGNESEVSQAAIAEMQVLRSYFYYLLIDNYGAVPYEESYVNAEEDPYRVKRGDICNRLIDIIQESIPYLPDAGSVNKNKVTKEMAWMLLGKLYLNGKIYKGESSFSAEDMDSVIANMNRVINLGGYSFESDRLAPFSVDNATSSETIFLALSDENGDDGLRHNFRTLHTLHQKTYDLQATPWNGCAVKPDFYDRLFAANDGYDDPDDISSVNGEVVDLRSHAFLRGQQYDINGKSLSDDNGPFILTKDILADVMNDGTDGGAVTRFSGYRVVKFEVEIGGGPIMNNDFPIFRLADAYLMRAEATLRGGLGADATADDDLNTIRNLANLPDVTATLDEVLDERGRELFMEGHRRSDLIRFGQFAARNWWLGADESDQGEHRLVFPVPTEQINTNPNLEVDPIDLIINE